MADIPHSWGAYARLQSKLSGTTSVVAAAALEAALNVVHQPDFNAEGVAEADMLRLAANAARGERHRTALLRQVQAAALNEGTPATGAIDDGGGVPTGASSLDGQVDARRELRRIESRLPADDWELLTDAAVGVPYEELAASRSSTSAALRSRVCRLRRTLVARHGLPH